MPWSRPAIFPMPFPILLSLVVILLLSPMAGDVLGHAFVLDSSPAPSESLVKLPAKVEVFLSEPVDDRYSEVRVLGPDGNQIDNKDTQHFDDDQSTLGVTLPQEGLEDGVYTVSTKMLSQIDGHVTEDAFVFGVGESTPLSSAAGNSQAELDSAAKSPFEELSVPDAIARYPALVGQVIVVGAAFASLWLWKPFAKVNWVGSLHRKNEVASGEDRKQRRTAPMRSPFYDLGKFRKRVDQRLVKMMLIGSVIVVLADFAMIFALAYSLKVGMVDAMTTKFGSIWLVRTGISFVLLALIVFVYLKVSKRAPHSTKGGPLEGTGVNPLAVEGLVLKREVIAILIVGIFTLLTTSLMGHGAAITTGAQIPIGIDFVHNLAAAVWIGGVFYLALAVVTKLRNDDGLDNQSKWSILCIVIPRFSTLPVVVLGIIVITGPFLLYLLEDDLNLTLASLYGKALLAKLITAAIMLTLGGYSQRVIHKDAIDALNVYRWQQHQQQVVISRSSETRRSRSTSASSSSSSPSDMSSSDKQFLNSQSKFGILLLKIRRKITRDKNEQHQLDRASEGDLGRAKTKYGNIIYDDPHGQRVEDLGGSNLVAGKGSQRNPQMGWLITISRFNRSIKIEAILGILLLGAVAVLTNTGLPQSEFQGQVQQNFASKSQQTDIQSLLITTSGANDGIGNQGPMGGYSDTQYLENGTARIELTIEPYAVGKNNFSIEFLNLTGGQINVRTVDIKLTQTEENIGPIEIQTNKISEGLFTANASFGISGPWEVLVEGVRNENNALNLVATFSLFVKPGLDQIDYKVTQIAMPDNRSQPLYPIYDSSRNSIWLGDTSLESGRIFEYNISNSQFREHKINGTNIITTMALDEENDMIWFVDPISKVLGSYDPNTNSSQLYNLPNNRIVPSSIAVRSNEFPLIRNASVGTIDTTITNTTATTVPSGDETRMNETANSNLGEGSELADRFGISRTPTVWVTSPSTGEVLIFDPQLENFTSSLSLPTPNSNPLGITIDSFNGQVWIAEGIGKIANIDPAANLTIHEYTPSVVVGGGESSGSIDASARSGGMENDTLISPTSLLIDPYTGSIYISEHDGHVVSVFNPVFKTFSDFPPLAEDALPFGMSLDKDRNLWVAEHVTNRLTVIDPRDGNNKQVTIPSASPFIQYLTTDNEGRVWFAAQRGNAIGYITSIVNPSQSTPAPGIPSSSVSSSPSGIPGQEGATTNSPNDFAQTPLTPLFNIGYEYLLGPLIAIGVIASATFYVNSVLSLKTSIRRVNELGARR
jgi:putative copper export protein/streptogramin lyase/methionine-rich copper-binding protein CopC